MLSAAVRRTIGSFPSLARRAEALAPTWGHGEVMYGLLGCLLGASAMRMAGLRAVA